MKIGVFGGTFDPIHFGHLLLAESCREQCGLDRVWFVPAATPPHKQEREISAEKHRVEMLSLAISGHASFEINTSEIDRGGVTYTTDTLEIFAAEQPDAEFFLLIGADSLDDFLTWRDPARICELALPIVINRPGYDAPNLAKLSTVISADRLAAAREHQVESPWIDLSSTNIRQRVRDQQSIRYRTPRSVEKYIETSGLYQETE